MLSKFFQQPIAGCLHLYFFRSSKIEPEYRANQHKNYVWRIYLWAPAFTSHCRLLDEWSTVNEIALRFEVRFVD